MMEVGDKNTWFTECLPKWDYSFSKKLQLLTRSVYRLRFLTQKQFKIAKLLVGNTKNANFTIFR